MFGRQGDGRNRGFSGVDLLVILVVVVVLALVMVPLAARYLRSANLPEALDHLDRTVAAAQGWARAHPDSGGTPVWPRDVVDLDMAAETRHFRYELADGAGEPATVPLVIRAAGRNGMSGVRIVVSVASPDADPEAPEIRGL